MFDITPIVKALFALMGAVVVYILIPYIKSKSTVEQQQSINGWIKIAVSAAEQLYAGSGRGEEKKTYVLNFLRTRASSWMRRALTR